MKLSHLRQIVGLLRTYRRISAIYRIADTTIKIVFDGDEALYFDMRKGHSHIFMCDTLFRSKVYHAPFDVMLAKHFNRADIIDISLYNNDKIIRITASQSSAYKESRTILQLEFTGKTTNAIILDKDETVLEALRHVDAGSSYRVVRVGQELLPPPPPPYIPKEYPIEDVRAYLRNVYEQELKEHLGNLKKQKKAILQKQLQKLQKRLGSLEDEEALRREIEQLHNFGNLVLANMHRIKPYMKTLEVSGFEGQSVTIALPQNLPSAAAISNYFFKRAKKAKQKVANLHIERENLQQKCDHLRHFIQTVEEAAETGTIEMLFPARVKGAKHRQSESIETFWVEGYKVMLGKSEKGNIELLENARARDIWLHLKDRPSAHVIIVTDKQNVPESVLKTAAKLCVDFTLFEKGRYLVDYTPRREVKIQEGANVLYNKYKTLHIQKG